MKKLITPVTLFLFLTAVAVLMGCARSVKRPAPEATDPSLKITNISGPVPVSGASDHNCFKIGRAETFRVLYLVAWGDSSIKKAMTNGNITKLHHVDYEYNMVTFYVPFYECYTVIAYGE